MVRPSTWIKSWSRSALLPSSRTTLPLTVTWPLSISTSAFRRDATPACARIFCSRSAAISLAALGRFGGRRRRRRGEHLRHALAGLVRPIHCALQLVQRGLALHRRLHHALGRLRVVRELAQPADRRRGLRLLLDDLARLLGQLLELAQR